MEKIQNDTVKLKQTLMDFRERECDITNQIERLERLEVRIVGLGAQVITDMPSTHSVAHDRLADLIDQKIELETSIKEDIADRTSRKNAIEKIVKMLRNSNERAVIRMRYFDGASWNEVRDMMFGWKDDYEGKEDSYLRRTHLIHSSALSNMAIVLDEEAITPTGKEKTI